MRTILSLALISLALHGCGSRRGPDETGTTAGTDSAVADAAGAAPATPPAGGCYRQVTGRDSTLLRLVVEGSAVTGELAVLPFEKDRARGPLRGTLAGKQVRADWQRSGEGVTEPYEVVFSLRGDTVTWQEGERVRRAGKWVLKDSTQGYTYVLVRATCP
jgi:hypothetical protein